MRAASAARALRTASVVAPVLSLVLAGAAHAHPAVAAAAKPGAGKPAVTIGDKNFPEENILGALYARALQAKGYTVKLKDNIGSSEITWKALTAGQIDLYPEYTGTLLTAVAGKSTSPTSAADAYKQAKAFASSKGFLLTNPTPFADSEALITKRSYASSNHLSSLGDLKKLGKKAIVGAPPEFATRQEGLLGLNKVYGVFPTFKPVAFGLSYTAIDSGKVNVQGVDTTDAQLIGNKYTVLKDPKHIFGFQNVGVLVNRSVAAKEGPAFVATLNAVSRLLTVPAVQALNKAVTIDKQSSRTVAGKFLAANHLL